MDDVTPQVLVSLVALGMGLAFVSADRRSATSRALAVALAAMGAAIFLNQSLIPDSGEPPPWSGWLALPEAVVIVAMLEWLLRVRRTVPAREDIDTRFGDRVLRVGQGCGLLYAVFALIWPDTRITEFARVGTHWSQLGHAGFWLFATPVLLAILSGTVSLALLMNRRPDRGERVRLAGFAICIPFFASGLILPNQTAAIFIVIGEMVLLIGAVHYHVRQGQQGLFMSRFLSPEVARLVSDRGLRRAMQEQQLTITVVACDLRGFSSYARVVPSQRVIQVLREYYDAVGQVVASYGGTIKDYAGDGILVLVGAPIALPDHARRGVELSRRLRDVCQLLIRSWSEPGQPLGIGVGVASGAVTVGVIGGISRLEYTAVGAAVNLASRLCDQAQDGEILLDEATVTGSPPCGAEAGPALLLKGFGQPVANFRI